MHKSLVLNAGKQDPVINLTLRIIQKSTVCSITILNFVFDIDILL